MTITEQILLRVSDDVAIWLRERRPESLNELGRLADDYLLARKGEGRASIRRLVVPAQVPCGGARGGPAAGGAKPQNSQSPPRGQRPADNDGWSRTNFRGNK